MAVPGTSAAGVFFCLIRPFSRAHALGCVSLHSVEHHGTKSLIKVRSLVSDTFGLLRCKL